jgi:hypothetical protein
MGLSKAFFLDSPTIRKLLFRDDQCGLTCSCKEGEGPLSFSFLAITQSCLMTHFMVARLTVIRWIRVLDRLIAIIP